MVAVLRSCMWQIPFSTNDLITVAPSTERGSQGEQHTIWNPVSCDTFNLPLPVDQSIVLTGVTSGEIR